MAPRREDPAEATDAIFAALAHASRRHVLLVLHLRGDEMSAGEIADRFACSWPTTSRHLRVLEHAGLVRVEARGRERVYRLDRRRLLAVAGDWLGWFSKSPQEAARLAVARARRWPSPR